MLNSKKAAQAVIRHKEHGSMYRLIRTTSRGSGTDLYWVMRGINEDGTEHKGTSMLSVDAWATGDWEVVK